MTWGHLPTVVSTEGDRAQGVRRPGGSFQVEASEGTWPASMGGGDLWGQPSCYMGGGGVANPMWGSSQLTPQASSPLWLPHKGRKKLRALPTCHSTWVLFCWVVRAP